MRSLTEIKGDKALDLVADLLEPVTEIFSDEEVSKAYNVSILNAIKVAIKNHKKAVKTIVALMNEEDPNTYEPNVVEIPAMLYQVVTDKEIQRLFTSQGQNLNENTSGSVTESTKGKA